METTLIFKLQKALTNSQSYYMVWGNNTMAFADIKPFHRDFPATTRIWAEASQEHGISACYFILGVVPTNTGSLGRAHTYWDKDSANAHLLNKKGIKSAHVRPHMLWQWVVVLLSAKYSMIKM